MARFQTPKNLYDLLSHPAGSPARARASYLMAHRIARLTLQAAAPMPEAQRESFIEIQLEILDAALGGMQTPNGIQLANAAYWAARDNREGSTARAWHQLACIRKHAPFSTAARAWHVFGSAPAYVAAAALRPHRIGTLAWSANRYIGKQ